MGLDYNKSHNFINFKGTAYKLNCIQALPGVYAFAGCDYTSAFSRKGKKCPVEIILKLDLEIIQKLIDSYVCVKWLDSKEVPQKAKGDNDTVMEHSGNDCVGEKDEVTDDTGNEDGDSNGDDDAMDDRE